MTAILGVAVAVYLKRKNKNMNSPIVKVEMQGWKMDSVISLGMTAVFCCRLIPFRLVSEGRSVSDSIITIVLSMIMLPFRSEQSSPAYGICFLISPEEETA